jgi:DNA polymerase III subunit alpha
MLGFYITGHPLDRYQSLMAKYADADLIQLSEKPDGALIRIGGLIKEVKTIRSKSGPMAFLTLENRSGTIESVVFSRIYVEIGDLLNVDTPIFIQGKLQKDEKANKIIAEQIVPFDEAETRWTTTVFINLDLDRVTDRALSELNEILVNHPGSCPGVLKLLHPNKSEILMELPKELSIKADSALQKEIRAMFGRNAWETVCTPATESPEASNGKSGYSKRSGKNANGH